jgi:hypothetical protein
LSPPLYPPQSVNSGAVKKLKKPMNNSPASSLIGEVKKYFLNQFHDLENQFKNSNMRKWGFSFAKFKNLVKLGSGNPFIF